MENDLKCPLCEDQYTDDNLPRLLVSCGHTFCELCLSKMITQNNQDFIIICPEDGQLVKLKDKKLTAIPKNFALVKMIQSKKLSNSVNSFKEPDFQMSKIVKNEEPQNDDQQGQQIVDAIVLSNSIGSQQKYSIQKQQQTKFQTQLNHQIKQKLQQNCKVHRKPLQVVCILDLKKICVNCAIFGDHKGHQFKSLQEIQHERMLYYSSILKIMENKQQVSQRISNQATCLSIMQILTNKKNKMKNTINDKFKKLIQAIQAKQKQTHKTLDTLIQTTEIKLKNLMKIDPQIGKRYLNWQERSYEQIKILQGNDFQSKLNLLFVDGNEQTDILEEGDKIIAQMNKHQQNLINQVQIAIDNIGLEFSSQIFNYIDSFVDIFDEIKKKKTKTRISKNQTFSGPQNSGISKNPQIDKQSIKNKKMETGLTPLIIPKIDAQLFKKISKDVHQQNLLQIQYENESKQSFISRKDEIIVKTPQKIIASIKRQKQMVSPSNKFINKVTNEVNQQLSPRLGKKNSIHNFNVGNSRKQESFYQDKIQRPTKKKLIKLKLPEKYDKMVQSLVNDQLETLDLTNAQLGDATILLISQFLVGSKVKTVKFIRNKLTDQAIAKMIPFLKGITTLNISQNFLTQRVLDILIENRNEMMSLKTVIMIQNKITQRKAKLKVDKLKSLDLVISL